MPYKIGTYRTREGKELNLDYLSPEEGKLFFWLMEQYQTAPSWLEFQQTTAERVSQIARKTQQQWKSKGHNVKWEEYFCIKSALICYGT